MITNPSEIVNIFRTWREEMDEQDNKEKERLEMLGLANCYIKCLQKKEIVMTYF